jgi:hypothetical protein
MNIPHLSIPSKLSQWFELEPDVANAENKRG